MPVILPIIKQPFADVGDRAEFPYQPDTMQELLSWMEGFTKPYQRIPEHGGVYIERREFNQILWLLTQQMIWGFLQSASMDDLDNKFTNMIDKGAQPFEVNFTVDKPTFVYAHFQVLTKSYLNPNIEWFNFEIEINDSQTIHTNPQFVLPGTRSNLPGAWNNVYLGTFLKRGDRYKLKGGSNIGVKEASGFDNRVFWCQ